MPDTTTVVDTYIEMWNEGDAERRRRLVGEAMTEDARYLDPVMAGEGIDGISAMIAGAQQQFPGHRFALHTEPDGHHDRLRFSWALNADGDDPVAIGTDFATISDDGRMRAITGFLEPSA